MAFLDSRKFFVFGLGVSGRAVADLLVSDGREVVAYDEDPAAVDEYARASGKHGAATLIRPGEGTDPEQALVSCDRVVLSPGVPLEHRLLLLAREHRIPIESEIEAAFHYTSANIVAVTGTNGKSTTVGIVGEILREAGIRSVVAGNVGKPFAGVVREDEPYRTVVLELSSFQLDTVAEFRADVAVLLNVTPDHLDRYHNSFDEYVESKSRILNRATDDTWFVYNEDDISCRRIAETFLGNKFAFSSIRMPAGRDACFLADNGIHLSRQGSEIRLINTGEFVPVGLHNLENAMAAAGAASAMDISAEEIRAGLRSYRPLPHRMEPVRVVSGVTYINDSKATNVDATVKSLMGLDGGAVLILGGKDKGGNFESLIPHLGRVRKAILIGEAKGAIRTALAGKCEVEDADDMSAAVNAAAKCAMKGDTVLLAPACASFDMFDNFEHRGEVFRSCVNELNAKSR